MGDLQATIEFLVELYKFYNIDLFIRGYYQFRLSFKQPKSCHAIQVEVCKGHGERGAFTLFPAFTTNDGQTAVSRTFNIYYKSEEVVLKDVFLFRVHLLVDSTKAADCIDKAALEMTVDMHFGDKEVRADSYDDLRLVTSRTLKFHFSCFKGLHHQLPLLFDYYYFSVLEMIVHANVVALGLPNWSILKPVKTGWFGKSTTAQRSATPAFYTTLFGSRSPFAIQFYGDASLKYAVTNSNPVTSESFQKASAIHRNLCAILAMAHSQLLRYFDEMMQYMAEKQRIKLAEKLDPADLVEGLCKKLETLQSCEEIFDEMCSDMSVLNNELALLWLQFQESFTLNEEMRSLLRQQHHYDRMMHLSEAFFVHELPWKSVLNITDSSFQKHLSMGQHVKSSRYLSMIPAVAIECAEVDGDSTSIPIFFEDRYVNRKGSSSENFYAVHGNSCAEDDVLEHKPLSFGILNEAFNDHSPQLKNKADSIKEDLDAKDEWVDIMVTRQNNVATRLLHAEDDRTAKECNSTRVKDESEQQGRVDYDNSKGNVDVSITRAVGPKESNCDEDINCSTGVNKLKTLLECSLEFSGNHMETLSHAEVACADRGSNEHCGTEKESNHIPVRDVNDITAVINSTSDHKGRTSDIAIESLSGISSIGADEIGSRPALFDKEVKTIAESSNDIMGNDRSSNVLRPLIDHVANPALQADVLDLYPEGMVQNSQLVENSSFIESAHAKDALVSGALKKTDDVSRNVSGNHSGLQDSSGGESLKKLVTCNIAVKNYANIECYGENGPSIARTAWKTAPLDDGIDSKSAEVNTSHEEEELKTNTVSEIDPELTDDRESEANSKTGYNTGAGLNSQGIKFDRNQFTASSEDEKRNEFLINSPNRTVPSVTKAIVKESDSNHVHEYSSIQALVSNIASNCPPTENAETSSCAVDYKVIQLRNTAQVHVEKRVSNSVFYEGVDVEKFYNYRSIALNAQLDSSRLTPNTSSDVISCFCAGKVVKKSSPYKPTHENDASNIMLQKAKQDVISQMNYRGTLYSDSTADFLIQPYFMTPKLDLTQEPVHFIVCVHGLDGNSGDLRLVRCFLEMALSSTKLEFLMSEVNQDNTFVTFEKQTEKLVSEIIHHLEAFRISPSRISFIGHSLGNIVIRSALNHPLMEPYVELFHTFLSLSGPHLGMVHHTSSLVSTGMWLLQKWKKSDSLLQLSLNDSSDMRDTFIYKLSQKKGLEYFTNVLLVSSVQDHYAPFHSSRIELPKSLRSNTQEYTIYREMMENLLVPLLSRPNRTLVRYTVYHCLPSSTNTFIGRAAHIAMLDSELFIEKLICTSAAKYFQ